MPVALESTAPDRCRETTLIQGELKCVRADVGPGAYASTSTWVDVLFIPLQEQAPSQPRPEAANSSLVRLIPAATISSQSFVDAAG